MRNYTTGKSDFLFFQTWLGQGASPFLTLNGTAPWTGWAPASPPASALYELTVWPDAVQGSVSVTAGSYVVTLDAVPLPWSCRIVEDPASGCYEDQLHGRIIPTAVSSGFGGMTPEVCGAMCRAANYTAPGDYCGTENADECWCGKVSATAKKLGDSACTFPCPGNASEVCGGSYKMSVFKATCAPHKTSGVRMTVATAADPGTVIATKDIASRIVEGAWNMLRVLSEPDRVRVWLNPSFSDIMGGAVPPKDERNPPHTATPAFDERVAAGSTKPVGLAASVANGKWLIDYASVLPPQLYPSNATR